MQRANEKSWRKITFKVGRTGYSGSFNIYYQFKMRANIYISIVAGSYCPSAIHLRSLIHSATAAKSENRLSAVGK